MPISVLLVDDHLVLRQGVATMLARVEGIKVVGEAASGEEGVRLALELRPDVVVMDLGLPGLGGTIATQQITGQLPGTRVVALSAFTGRQHVISMLQAGAVGYLTKACAFEELADAIAAVARGERFFGREIMPTILEHLSAPPGSQSRDRLTPREREVLQLLASGKAMKEAAVDLNVSTKTIETHRRAIMEKLQIFSVAELTKHAIREGLATLH